MSDTTYKSKIGYKPPVELEYHEGMPEIKSVWDNMRDDAGKILDQVEEHIVAQCSAAVGVKIDREELIKALRYDRGQYEKGYADGRFDAADLIGALMEENKMLLNTIPADKKLMLDHIRKLEHQLPKRGEWNNHDVACLLAEMFGDDCACNLNGIDEWLPQYCEFAETCCPNPDGVACWE